MTLSDFILKKGEIMLTQQVIEDVPNNSPFIFGKIERVSDLSDMYVLDEIVFFDAREATSITIEDVTYYLTIEDNIYTTLINTTP